MGKIHAKMFLKKNNWFDLKPTGLSILFGRQVRALEIKVERETLTIKKNYRNGQTEIHDVGVFVKPFDILPTWTMACGRYACLVEPKRSVAGSIKLFIKDQFLMAKLCGGVSRNKTQILGTINETEAIILGYGRGTSETVFLGNKMITYNGNKFVLESSFKTFCRRAKILAFGAWLKEKLSFKKHK